MKRYRVHGVLQNAYRVTADKVEIYYGELVTLDESAARPLVEAGSLPSRTDRPHE
jgi:hypothetical protein